MVGHEAEGVHAVAETTSPLLEQEVETVPVGVGDEDGLTAVTPKNNVIESAGEMDAWFACHGEKIPQRLNLSTWKPDPTVASARGSASPRPSGRGRLLAFENFGDEELVLTNSFVPIVPFWSEPSTHGHAIISAVISVNRPARKLEILREERFNFQDSIKEPK
jgi:hypothetical protein